MKTLFKGIRDRFRRWQYREGRTLSRFIARDVRREILIVSTAKIGAGIIVGRVRTTNLLYVRFVPKPEFEPARELRLDELWHWPGQSWGGLPNGTSLFSRLSDEPPNSTS
ncbi:MAG: hypothetical protein ACRC8S_17725 [Fimbriiglobus sp.]